MSKRTSIELIQKSQLSGNDFSKEWFIKLLTDNTTQDQFNRFCKEIMLLNEFYDSSVGLTATDRPDKIIELSEVTFELSEIDFEQAINFKRLN